MGANHYSFSLTDKTTGAALNSATSVTGTSFTPTTGLMPGHSYTWTIAAVSTNKAFVSTSASQAFSLILLLAPTPTAPANNVTIAAGASYDTPTFTWNSVAGADHYAITVSANGKAVVSSVNVMGTSFTPSAAQALTPGQTYTWTIAAVSADSKVMASNSATPQTFTLAALQAPTPTGPTGTITASNGYDLPTFTWSSVAGAASYAISVTDKASPAVPVINTTVMGTSFTATTPLTPGHSYTWAIGAVSTNGLATTSNSKTPQAFALAALPGPTLTNPSGTIAPAAGYDLPTFTWSSVAGAANYAISVTDKAAPTVPAISTTVSGTSFTPTTALTPGHSYTWSISAVSTNGKAMTATGTPQTFTVASLLAPTPIGPSGPLVNSPGYELPTFTWTGVVGANHYAITLTDTNTNTVLIKAASVTGTSFTPSAAQSLTPGHGFTWSIAAVSTNGQASTPSSLETFNIAALLAPTPASPIGPIAASASYDSPTFAWNSVVGADHYVITLTDTTAAKPVVIINAASVSSNTFTPAAPLTPGHTYTWSVGAVSATVNGVTSPSALETFTLAPLQTPMPTGPSGNISASNGYDTPTFGWGSVTGAAHYVITLTDTSTQTAIVKGATVSGTSFTPSAPLTPGHNYSWSITAVSTNGQATAPSALQTFMLAGLAAPTLSGPIGTILASSGYDIPTFGWSSVAGADHYAMTLTDTTNVKPVVIVNGASETGTSFTPTVALTPGHTYTWSIGAVSTNLQAIMPSAVQTFTLAALQAPVPNSLPATISASSGYDTPTFSWSSVTGADHYAITLTDTTTKPVVTSTTNVYTTSFAPATALTPGHSYTWSVSAVSTNGQGMTSSGTPQMFALAPLQTPTPAGPSGTIAVGNGYTTPTFSWSSVPGVGSYSLSLTDKTANAPAVNFSLSANSFTPSAPLTPGHTYTWTVGAVSVNGQVTAPGSVQMFMLATLLAPTPTAPINGNTIAAGAGYDMPTFTWGASSGADHYTISVTDTNTGVVVIKSVTVSGTSFTPSTAQALTPGHNFSWTVGAASANGQIVVNSAAQAFSLAGLAVPNPGNPSGAIAAGSGFDTPTFTWSSVAGAGQYAFSLTDTSANAVLYKNTPVNAISFTPSTALTPGHNYSWTVAAVSTNGQLMPNSAAQTFNLAGLQAPTLTAPIGALGVSGGYDTPTFSWGSVAGADHYTISLTDTTSNTPLNNATSVSATSFTSTIPLTPGHGYKWSVAAVSANGTAFPSASVNFTLTVLQAPTPGGPSGAISASSGYDSPIFSWSTVTGADHYSLTLTDTTNNSVVNNATSASGTSFIPSPALTPGHSYSWSVAAVSANGTTYTSSLQTFSLAALQALTPTGPNGNIAASSGYDTPTFSWNSVTGADHYAFSLTDNTTNTAIDKAASQNGTSFIPSPGLTPGHKYTWSVAAVSTNGTAFPSAVQTFTLALLQAPTPVGPIGNIPGGAGYDAPNFTWSSVTGADHYAFSLTDTTAGIIVNNATSVSGVSFTPSAPLTPGDRFAWSVAAVSANGTAVSSPVESFTLAALIVNTTADTETPGKLTLRDAINLADGLGGFSIAFAIPTTDPGYNGMTGAFTIQPQSSLPSLASNVFIDGTSEAGYLAQTYTSPIIVISGAQAGGGNGLTLSGNGNTIQGLVINDFSTGDGIEVYGTNNTIQGNYIGSDVSGTVAAANSTGIELAGNANTIGGDISAARNLISGNTNNGIQIDGNYETIAGNWIGLKADNSGTLRSGNNGILIDSGGFETIGGTTLASGNFITGAQFGAIEVTASSNNLIEFNTIGTDATGTTITNFGNGSVDINDYYGGANNQILNNVVAGAGAATNNPVVGGGDFGYGIRIAGAGATGNIVAGNFIGTDRTGSIPLTNEDGGVDIKGGANGNTIGGTAAGDGNTISGNGFIPGIGVNPNGDGVIISDTGTTNNLVEGNEIGVGNSSNVPGIAGVGNGADGVYIGGGATDNTIGGAASGAGNVISGNLNYGVDIESSGTTGNMVLGNFIGTNEGGTSIIDANYNPLGNGVGGVLVNNGASLVTIAGNVISDNPPPGGGGFSSGIDIFGSGTNHVLVTGNFIGTDVTGTAFFGNSGEGIDIQNAYDIAIGGAATPSLGGAGGNLISGNDGDGIDFSGSTSVGNLVQGNYIGTDITGTLNVGNSGAGILIGKGATVAVAGDLISFNGASGINNDGMLTLTNDTISQNTAGNGGGLYNSVDGTATVTDSTFNNNRADYGAGLYNYATLNVSNSTIADNTANFDGGGIQTWGNLTLVSDTIVGNTNAGVSARGGTDTLENTLLSDNGALGNLYSPNGTQFISNGYNLSDDNGAGFLTAPTDQINTNPRLGPLQNNGGSTLTFAPLPGSPAIGVGAPSQANVVAQNGVMRLTGLVDIGAYQTPPSANPLIVTTTADTGIGSLRDAIEWANNDPGQTITFAIPTTDPNFSGGVYTITLAGAELPQITANMTIDGPGASELFVSGNQLSRVFDIASGATVSISGLTVTQGNLTIYTSSNAAGGGILNAGNLTLTNVTVSYNHVDLAGGGVESTGTLAVSGSTFTHNSASFQTGGGINANNFTITNSSITFNMSYAGGGIAGGDPASTITNSDISYNTGTGSGGGSGGGGLALNSGVTITNSTITHNTTNSNGGGINFYGGVNFANGIASNTITIIGSTIADNTAALEGAGVWNDGYYNGTTILTNSTVTDNISQGDGGGIYNDYYGNVKVTGGAISGNSAQGNGGGVANLGEIAGGGGFSISGATITGNTAVQSGGGLSNDGTLTIDQSTISSNIADGMVGNGGGGGLVNTDNLTLTNSTLADNQATQGNYGLGGAILNVSATITLNNTTLADNAALAGGALFNQNRGDVYATNITVSGNNAVDGGGLYNNVGLMVLDNSIVGGNTLSDLTTPSDLVGNGGADPSSSYNLIGPGGSGGLIGGNNGNIVVNSAAALGLDPAGLASNGGATQTIALEPGSPALGTGDPSQAGATSQNGVIRSATDDIGAFQLNPLTAGALTPPTAFEALAFSNVTVFHFTDADPSAAASDYTAVVTLGDGNTVTLTSTPSANGQIVANPGGGFDVQLSYTYSTSFSNGVFGVQVTDAGGATTGAATNTFTVIGTA